MRRRKERRGEMLTVVPWVKHSPGQAGLYKWNVPHGFTMVTGT